MGPMKHFIMILLMALTPCLQVLADTSSSSLAHTSRLFLDTPYEFSNIKDPFGPQQGVFYDPSHLDCMTYVMSTIALSGTPEHWLQNWLTLRYQDSQDFWGRNHFASIDFNPVLERYFGFFDLSKQMPGHIDYPFQVEKPLWLLSHMPTLCQKNSCPHILRQWQALSQKMPTHISISTIPYEQITTAGQLNSQFTEQLPEISIIEFIRLGWPIGHMIQIPESHMGFLIKKKGQLILRHAKWHQSVTDEDFLTYIKKIHHDPTHIGIHILSPKHQ